MIVISPGANPRNHVWKKSASENVPHIRSHEGRYAWGGAGSGSPIAAEYAACVDIGPLVVKRRDFMHMGGFDESFSYPGKGAMGLDFDVATRAWLSGRGTSNDARLMLATSPDVV